MTESSREEIEAREAREARLFWGKPRAREAGQPTRYVARVTADGTVLARATRCLPRLYGVRFETGVAYLEVEVRLPGGEWQRAGDDWTHCYARTLRDAHDLVQRFMARRAKRATEADQRSRERDEARAFVAAIEVSLPVADALAAERAILAAAEERHARAAEDLRAARETVDRIERAMRLVEEAHP